eukprot:scaffold10325_cov123-Isochrysis_galbana.AAC.4
MNTYTRDHFSDSTYAITRDKTTTRWTMYTCTHRDTGSSQRTRLGEAEAMRCVSSQYVINMSCDVTSFNDEP